ncbi:MAG: YbaK/EbsC family protein [Clostridiaceae bacterium]
MSIEAVKKYLEQWSLEDRVQEFTTSSATVELAAEALSVIPARIAKSMSFKTKEGCIIIVAAGDGRVNNGKFKAAFGEKAKMVPLEEVQELTGHPVGGVCPFALKEGVKVYLDKSLERFDTVFPAAGTPSSAIELNLEELFISSKALAWVDVCKIPE